MKKTLVIGASINPERYSFKAIHALVDSGIETHALGLKKGVVAGVPIMTEAQEMENIDTVTLYVGPKNQEHWLNAILSLHPRRVIFNPGTENLTFEKVLESNGIGIEHACTLVLLATHQF
jgi:predicted CoA-binding protein